MRKSILIILAVILAYNICLAEQLRLRNMKPVEIDSLLRVTAQKGLTITERIDLYSEMFLGTKYSWTPTGDGRHSLYDPQPLFSFDLSNCMVLCEHSLAMAISDSWDNFFNNLQHIRYRDGVIGIKTRNHYTMADWVPENTWILDNVTKEIGGEYVDQITRHIAYSEFFKDKGLADLRYIKPDQDYRIDYIRWQDIPKIKKNIKQGDIMAMILKDKDNIFSGHMILAVEVDGELYIREASNSKMTTFQTEFDEWAGKEYFRKKYCGIIVSRVKKDLNKANAVVLPWNINEMK
ncbi:MAG: N-acetylmuramoyl-L-alanine amidase-like domain-containing protein [Fidelibacterota bacterium]